MAPMPFLCLPMDALATVTDGSTAKCNGGIHSQQETTRGLEYTSLKGPMEAAHCRLLTVLKQ